MNQGGAGARSLNIELQATLNPAGEPAAALGDLDRAEFVRPVIDVLEQVAMNGRQTGEVKVARRHRLKRSRWATNCRSAASSARDSLMSSLLRRTLKSGG